MFAKIYNKVLLLIILILSIYTGVFFISSTYDLNTNIKTYDYKYNKAAYITNDQVCEIFDCTAIQDNDRMIYYDKGSPILVGLSKSEQMMLHKRLGFDKTHMSLFLKISDRKNVQFNLINEWDKKYTIILSTLPLIVLIFIYVIASTIKEEQEDAFIQSAGNEALLANKTMINITENIHHELNTPLEVLDNKIEKIHRSVRKIKTNTCVLGCGDGDKIEFILDAMEEDFDFIKNSSEQIYAVLEKMKGFKHLRYSNGNKTVKEIIMGGFKIINIENTDFEFTVDDKLYEYRLQSDVLMNADLLSIMLNHIKNSLEADSSKIFIVLTEFKNEHLKMRIIDNGNGIPKEAQKNIFKANFTTKSTGEGVRGNGMYLNQHILQGAGGNIVLIDSSKKGTTLELTLPCYKKPKEV